MLQPPASVATPPQAPSADVAFGRQGMLRAGLAFVLLSLVGLQLTPVFVYRHVHGLRAEATAAGAPVRVLVGDAEVAFARMLAAARGWHLSGDNLYVAEYAQAQMEVDEALEALGPLAVQLGPEAAASLRELREVRQALGRPGRAPVHGRGGLAELEQANATQQQYARAAGAGDRLRRAAEHAAAQHQAAQRSAERLGVVLWAVLALAALLSMAAVAWCFHRFRRLTQHVRLLTQRYAEQVGAAEAAVRGRDEVLAMVSHDLRSPLTAIEMSATLLQAPLPPSQQKKHLGVVVRSAGRMNALIRDILDVTRIEAGGKLSLNQAPVDVRLLVEELCTSFQAQCEAQTQLLSWFVAADVASVPADRGRLLQVLSNLVANAVKFTPEGGRITIDVRHGPGGVQFAVSDTGLGIAEEELERIFEPYWQPQAAAHLGAGLGLTISRSIVEAHGGCMWVKSRPGEGSTFFFLLPAAEVGQAAPPPSLPKWEPFTLNTASA